MNMENPKPICQGANHLDRLLDSGAGLTEFPGDRNRACDGCGTAMEIRAHAESMSALQAHRWCTSDTPQSTAHLF